MHITFHILLNSTELDAETELALVNFLHTHLEKYRDSPEDIRKALQYAMRAEPHPGGLLILAREAGEIRGAVVMNKTGMEGYIPENILVYIAVHPDMRGKGLGKQLMEMALENCKGSIALHVEKDNPARFLYEKLGFQNPYLEMRLKR